MATLDSNLSVLCDQIKTANLSYKDFQHLPAFKLLQHPRVRDDSRTQLSRRTYWITGSVIVILAILYTFSSLQFLSTALSWLVLKCQRGAGEECLIRAPPKFVDWFRPPVNCSVCRNVKKVDTVPYISTEEFTQKYAYTSRPLVVRNAMKNWTASSVFDFKFFQKLYIKEFPGSLDVLEEHCQFFGYKTEFHNLREVLKMSKERSEKMWYVGWSNCDISVANVLRQHYARPWFLPFGSESGRFDWIFMGKPGYGANMHVDNVGKPSWQAQIRGSKKWTLEPPPECYFECRTLEVTVEPNDIIVLDTDTWFHGTLIVGDEVSITIGSEYD